MKWWISRISEPCFAFALVCTGVLILRKREPDRPRAFRTPWVPVVPGSRDRILFLSDAGIAVDYLDPVRDCGCW